MYSDHVSYRNSFDISEPTRVVMDLNNRFVFLSKFQEPRSCLGGSTTKNSCSSGEYDFSNSSKIFIPIPIYVCRDCDCRRNEIFVVTTVLKFEMEGEKGSAKNCKVESS